MPVTSILNRYEHRHPLIRIMRDRERLAINVRPDETVHHWRKNDISVIHMGWLDKMKGHLTRQDVGIVEVKLLYKSDGAFYNPNLSIADEEFDLAQPPRLIHPWERYKYNRQPEPTGT